MFNLYLKEQDYLHYDNEELSILRKKIKNIKKFSSSLLFVAHIPFLMYGFLSIVNLASIIIGDPILSLGHTAFATLMCFVSIFSDKLFSPIINSTIDKSPMMNNLGLTFYQYFNKNNESLKIFFAKIVEEVSLSDFSYENTINKQKLHDFLQNVDNKKISHQDIELFLSIDNLILNQIEQYTNNQKEQEKNDKIKQLASKQLNVKKDNREIEKEFNFTNS